jgi:hypothetical protein
MNMNGLILSINNSIQMKFMFLTIQVASQKIITRGFPESKYSRLTSGFNSTILSRTRTQGKSLKHAP